jgi:hypothetical protein
MSISWQHFDLHFNYLLVKVIRFYFLDSFVTPAFNSY